MIRITELSLPLDADHHALRRAIVRRLQINDADQGLGTHGGARLL